MPADRRDCLSAALGGLVLAAVARPSHPMRDLTPCPDRPNCVSSLATDAARRVAPLDFTDDPARAQQRLVAAIEAMPRSRVVEQAPGWIVAEFRSWLFGFVDDVQCTLDAQARVFHVRSASRTGYWDLGVNRQRVDALRAALSAR